MLGKALIQAASGGEESKLGAPLLFICSRNSSNIGYLHALTTTGTNVGIWQSPEVLDGCYAFFRNPYVYFTPAFSSLKLYKIDCNTMATAAVINLPVPAGRLAWQPLESRKLIAVDVESNFYRILDLNTNLISSVAYSSKANNVVKNGASLTFFDETATSISSIQNRVWFQGGSTVDNTDYVSYADWTGSVLGAETFTNVGQKGRISAGYTMSSTKGFLLGGNDYYARVTPSQTSPTSINLPSYSYGGSTYAFSQSTYHWSGSTGANSTYIYGTFQRGVTPPYAFRVAAFDPFASTSPTAVDLGIPLGNSNTFTSQEGGFCCRINESDYVALVNYSSAAGTTDNVRIRIVNGTSTVAAYSLNLGSQYTSGNNAFVKSHTIFPAMWSTDLLYAGTTYS